MKTVTLFHFTSREHLPSIMSDGYLKTVESNVSRRRPHAGPDVVWLTTRPEVGSVGLGLQSAPVDKQAIRFTVELPAREVHKWHAWARSHGSDEKWIAALARSGGSSSWRVIERPIPRASWVAVHDLEAGVVLDDRVTS